MAQIVMTVGQALREVSYLVLSKQPNGASQADLYTAIYEGVLQPLGTLITVMHQLPMAAQRMSQQQHNGSRRDKQRYPTPREIGDTADQRTSQHAKKPERFARCIANTASAHRQEIGGIDPVMVDARRERVHVNA